MNVSKNNIFILCSLFVILVLFIQTCGCKTKNIIYLDNNGTTKIFPGALDKMNMVYNKYYGNASGLYTLGGDSKRLLEDSRHKISQLLGCNSCEIYFTSGATESNNIAIRGIYQKHKSKGNHVVTSSIEHPSVTETVKSLQGAKITTIPVDSFGIIDYNALNDSLSRDTVLVTIIMGNNEIGTIQDVKRIAAICKAKNIHFHCDMTQVIGKYKVDLNEIGVDSATGSGHKFHGPKATGFLYLRKGTNLDSCMSGGHQEKNVRSGTENIPGIVAMIWALQHCYDLIDKGKDTEIMKLRNYMRDQILEKVPGVKINGHPKHSLYNTLSICIPTNSRRVVELLDEKGICVNTGSACSKGSESTILSAIGTPVQLQKGSLRISLGFLNTNSEIKYATKNIISICLELMKVSKD
jgi:cysteine desulfurase